MFNLRERIGYLQMLSDTCPNHPQRAAMLAQIRALKRRHRTLKALKLHSPDSPPRLSSAASLTVLEA